MPSSQERYYQLLGKTPSSAALSYASQDIRAVIPRRSSKQRQSSMDQVASQAAASSNKANRQQRGQSQQPVQPSASQAGNRPSQQSLTGATRHKRLLAEQAQMKKRRREKLRERASKGGLSDSPYASSLNADDKKASNRAGVKRTSAGSLLSKDSSSEPANKHPNSQDSKAAQSDMPPVEEEKKDEEEEAEEEAPDKEDGNDSERSKSPSSSSGSDASNLGGNLEDHMDFGNVWHSNSSDGDKCAECIQ